MKMNEMMDPLSIYDYPINGFENFGQPVPPNDVQKVEFNYPVKQEPSNPSQIDVSLPDKPDENAEPTSEEKQPETSSNASNDDKPFMGKRKVKQEGRSSYWSEKITQKDYPFYGCAVCNICYVDLADLDKHIATHKNRITSYDLKIRNQMMKKKLKKEKRKLKKLGKGVKKESETELEIKPEDGYIGHEKAVEYNGNDSNNGSSVNDNASNDANVARNDSSKGDGSGDKSKVRCKKATEPVDQETMNLQKIFKCFACEKQFQLSYYLKLHVRSHTDEKPYTCPKCGQSFITASKLGRHDKRFHLQVKFQCRICYRYFSRFECLTTHFDRKHADDKIEGEPYDYNAILPYLKELEEQLREKAEETKPKAEDLWTDGWQAPSSDVTQNSSKDQPDSKDHFVEFDFKEDKHIIEDKKQIELEPLKILVEDVKIHHDGVEVKREADNEMDNDDCMDNASFKDESFNASDEDYFPLNTWASTPKTDEPPPPTDPLTCGICNKRISTPSYMKVHMRTHTGERPFKCHVCSRGFITSSKMHRHALTHDTWDGEQDLKTEEMKEETEDCDGESKEKSGKRSKFSKKLKKNGTDKKTKYQKRPHACEFCHQRFLHLETLQIHKLSHAGEDLVYKCKFCLSEFNDEESLGHHEATHVGPKPYLCTICGKAYKKRETMVYHRKHHKPLKEFVCDVCSKSFSARCKLQRHLAGHRGARYSLQYECPVCAHAFRTRYHVRVHLATHQREGLIVEQNRNEILAMVLQNARKIFKDADPSANPDELLPTNDERSRVCNICGEVFQHFYYLEEHLKGHGSMLALEDQEDAEERKHKCQVCNKAFKLHYYLKLHSYTHTKEKPHTCQQCGKGFITRGKLKRHAETHAGLKKYQCHICCKFFTRPSYLRIHVRTIHGTQDYNFRLHKTLGLGRPEGL